MKFLEKIVLFLWKKSSFELDFNATHRAPGHAWYGDGDHIRLINSGPSIF